MSVCVCMSVCLCVYMQGRDYVETRGGNCLLVLCVIVLHVVSVDAPSRAQMRLAAGEGSLSASPDPIAAIGGGVLLLMGREGSGGEGVRKGRGKGRDCLLFILLLVMGLPCAHFRIRQCLSWLQCIPTSSSGSE